MMTAVFRGAAHCEQDYTRAGDSRQEKRTIIAVAIQETSGTWYAARGIRKAAGESAFHYDS
jgi:hypothetical protein